MTETYRGDYSIFAERVEDIIKDECSVVYTDFVADLEPIMDALRKRDLTCARAFWKEVSCPADYHYLGVFSKERMQCMLFIPSISQLKTHAEMSDDFIWRDVQLSKGKVNGPRPVTIWVGEKQEKLNNRMVPCGGVKVCSVDRLKFFVVNNPRESFSIWSLAGVVLFYQNSAVIMAIRLSTQTGWQARIQNDAIMT